MIIEITPQEKTLIFSMINQLRISPLQEDYFAIGQVALSIVTKLNAPEVPQKEEEVKND